MPDAAQAVHDIQHDARRTGSVAGERADERQGVGLLALCEPGDVGKVAVGDVLQAAGHARRLVLLQVGHVDDLGERLGDQPRQVRTRVVFAEEARFDVRFRIVVENRTARSLYRVNIHAFGQVLAVAHALQLVVETLVHPDLFGRHADGDQVLGDARHHFGSRTDLRRSRAVHLDADHVFGRNKPRPGVFRAGIAGERLHPGRQHLLDHFPVHLGGGGIDGVLGMDSNHLARIRSRHPRLRRML